MTILKDFIRPYRQNSKKYLVAVFKKKQVQMDSAEIGENEVNGKKQKLYVFISVLGYFP